MKFNVWVFVIGVFFGGVVMIFTKGIFEEKQGDYDILDVSISDKPLEKYSIENLGNREYQTLVEWGEIIFNETDFVVREFSFVSDDKKVSGLAHIPTECMPALKCPVIVQLRGYAEPENYQSGYGTWKSARQYAKAGFISLAPDFLGYGRSDKPSADIFEARFQTYTTVLNLLTGVEKADFCNGNIGIWGHSNGGHIALTVLEISRRDYPTVLWAPVSAGFPYSILYYMYGNEKGDEMLRFSLNEFENIYDSDQFNLLNFLERIKAPVLLHSGTADKLVPIDWSRNLILNLKKLDKQIEYYEYETADHNLNPYWDSVIAKDLKFFKKWLN